VSERRRGGRRRWRGGQMGERKGVHENKIKKQQ